MLLRALIFLCLAAPALAWADVELHLDGDIVQGGMVLGTTEVGAKVTLGDRPVRVSPDGRFVFGFGRDVTGEVALDVHFPNGDDFTRTLKIATRDYAIERVDGLPSKMVTPPANVLARIKRENKGIAEVRALDTPETWFAEPFVWPALGRVSGVYGSQRVLNGKPRRPHFGLDVAAKVGTPVTAPAGGIVALAETDLYYTGGTVMIDHGHGITSVFSHLSSVDTAVGTKVAPGDLIGAIGATGRATGPHLDWRGNWFAVRLDPQRLLGPMPGAP